MPKVTQEELLKKLGFDVAELEKDDADLEAILTAHNEKEKAHWFELFENSDELKNKQTENEGKIYAKHQKIVDGAIKKAGLVLTDEQAKLKPQEKIELLVSHLTTTNSGTKEIGDLHNQLLDLKNKYSDLEKASETKIKEAFDAADKKSMADRTHFHLKQKFISVPKDKLVGNEHLDLHWIALESKLKEKYDISFDDKGEFVFYKKGTSQKAEGTKDGRAVLLTPDEIITSQLKENKSWAESNGSGKGGNQQQRQQQDNGQNNNTGNAAEARLKQMQELAAQ